MNLTEYTVAYFLKKFSEIPEENWFVGEFQNPVIPSQHCAFGHCGCEDGDDENEEANALDRLFREHGLKVYAVNDGDGSNSAGLFTQDTPKARILAALESFK